MDLLDRYLAAIGRELPEAQRADITAELRDVLMNRIEEKEAELGRPLERRELEDVLRDYGHPLVVAGRYRGRQHLIGPEIYPFWWKALKVTLAWVAGVYVVLAVLGLIAQTDTEVVTRHVESSLPGTLVFTFGVVTLVAAFMERYGKRQWLTSWRPRDLPPVRGRKPSTFDLAAEAVAGLVALLWWVGAVRFGAFIPDYGMRLSLAPVWAAFYAPILVYWVLEIGSNVLALAQPGRTLTNGLLRAGRYVYGAAILAGVLRSGHFVTVASDRIPEPALAMVQANFDQGFRMGISATILFMAGYAVFILWRVRGALAGRRPLSVVAL
jgi:hypothetical protein